MRKIQWMLFVGLLIVGCSSPSDVVEAPDVASDTATVDVSADVDSPVDASGSGDVPVVEIEWDFRASDEMIEEVVPQCEGEGGCFLDPCQDNSDCQSGWCVEHMGEGVCSQHCQEDCPPGWLCKQVGASDPDLVFICVSGAANLCKPCKDGADCKTVGGAEDVCVDYGEQGSFCGGTCATTEDCPWGFSCLKTVTVDGIDTSQCVSDAGVCPCTGKSVALGLWTPCEKENEFGICAGKRICLEDGLGNCDALDPENEECNGLDDDCDGEADEPTLLDGEYVGLCDDLNECTVDSCIGEVGCQHEALDSGECKDGDACTVGDHCTAGVCAGSPVECDDSNPCTDDTCDGFGGCAFELNEVSCDDDDVCTVADRCDEGECIGVEVSCECQVDADCAALEDGDLCNGTLICDDSNVPYSCVIDPDTPVDCPAPGEGPNAPCLAASCDPESGDCSLVPTNQGWSCNDGNDCTVGESCDEGLCTGGQPANCADGNACTDDACDPFVGCTHDANQSPCSDGDVCTIGDLCDAGDCASGEEMLACLDGNPCTADSCDATAGCLFVNIDGECSDGNACTDGDACVDGECISGDPVMCDDENLCTSESCDAILGCLIVQLNGPCDDGNACTTDDHCQAGQCTSSNLLSCDDGNACTADTCQPEGGCNHLPAEGDCDDGNVCTEGDSCEAGQCAAGNPLVCDDENPCTTDSCNVSSGCVFKLNSVPCNDDDLCTTGDHCHLGDCIGGEALPCNDNNPCTDDACDAQAGCAYTPNAEPCSDGDSCTEDDSCANGWCKAGPQVDCDDNDPCTDDWCAENEGCVHGFNSAPCSDDDACTIGDACLDGACAAGIGVLLCDDGLFCNGLEVCDPAQGCIDGTDPEMSDGVSCTSDLCDEENNIVIHVTVDALCDDQEYCNGIESCHLTEGCQDGTPVAIDDGHACTLDSCDEDDDQILHLPDDGLCDDEKDCTLDSCDAELGCQYEKVDGCGGPHYVLKGEPNPATVFNTIAETHYYPNNLVNGIWHGPSNLIIAGHAYDEGFWSYDANNGTYQNKPNKGSGDYDRMVFMPQTRVVVHTDNQYIAAPADGIWVGTIDDDGSVSSFQLVSFSDGFNGICNLMSTTPSDFMCFTGSAIRHYSTAEGSHVFTYLKTTNLSPAPNDDCSGGCYQGTFAWDGKYYYFSYAGSNSNNLQYEVYSEAGSKLSTHTASGGGAISGAYFDWSSGRYSTHDGWGNRSGGNIHWPSNGSQNNDTQNYGPQSPYHDLL